MMTLNGYEVIPTQFPDGTTQVWNVPKAAFSPGRVVLNRDGDRTGHEIHWRFQHDGELVTLQQLVDLLNSHAMNESWAMKLVLPFLPYGRQDKEIANHATFGLHSFSQLINAMRFHEVLTIDAHNPRACVSLINNFVNVLPWEFIGDAIDDVKPRLVIFPDDGAKARYRHDLVEPSAHPFFAYAAKKSRDPSSGHVVSMQFGKEVPDVLKGPALIIDDICDGGATFIKLAELLHRYSVHDISLYVSHGIFSRGTEPLISAGIQRIYAKEGRIL